MWPQIRMHTIGQSEWDNSEFGGKDIRPTTVMSSLSLKPSSFTVEKSAVRGLPQLARTTTPRVEASGGNKIKTDAPYGTTGLAIWAVTLAGLLAGGALLVYYTSALGQ